MFLTALIFSSFFGTVLQPSVSLAAPSSLDVKAEEARVQTAVAKEKKILNQYSLEELNSAGTYLLAVFEASLDGKKTKILECDPASEKAQLWMSGPLHALIDEKTELEAKAMAKTIERDLKKSDKKWRACADQCQCASYMAVVEQIENSSHAVAADSAGSASAGAGKKEKTLKLSVSDQNRLKITTEWLGKENKKTTAAASAQCATRQAWFCKSALQTYLNEAAQE